ncbi:MAG: haloacid dehalogenase-like hydrolase [Gammaproteobacteria bacterium]
MGRTVAIFDVDGTLVPRPSTEIRFVRCMARHGLLTPARMLRYAGRLPARLWADGWLGFRTNKAHLSGLETSELESLAERFVENAGEALWNRPVLDRLRHHQSRGDAVLLLTGTPDFLAGAIGRHLGADAWEASVLPRRAGRVGADRVLQHPHGPRKLALAREMARAAGGTLADAWAYGDAWGDRFLLEAVAHPVVVDAGTRLVKLARRNDWEVLMPAQA